mgnify:CR=1 FL=1
MFGDGDREEQAAQFDIVLTLESGCGMYTGGIFTHLNCCNHNENRPSMERRSGVFGDGDREEQAAQFDIVLTLESGCGMHTGARFNVVQGGD